MASPTGLDRRRARSGGSSPHTPVLASLEDWRLTLLEAAVNGDNFDRVAKGVGTRVIKRAVRAPNMNPIGERFVGSLRREALDHVLLLGEQKLEDIARQYVLFFNKSRPHQGIGQRIPDSLAALEEEPGRNMVMYGGGEAADHLWRRGLVDELGLWTRPVLFGRGERPFHTNDIVRMELAGSTTFSSGVTLMCFKPSASR